MSDSRYVPLSLFMFLGVRLIQSWFSLATSHVPSQSRGCRFSDFFRPSDFFFSFLFSLLPPPPPPPPRACIVCVTTMRVNWWLSGQFWLRKSSSFSPSGIPESIICFSLPTWSVIADLSAKQHLAIRKLAGYFSLLISHWGRCLNSRHLNCHRYIPSWMWFKNLQTIIITTILMKICHNFWDYM